MGKIKCPRCGSTNTAEYLYGLPAFDEKLEKDLAAGKVVLGGCKIWDVDVNGKRVNGMPRRFCNDCKKKFASPPLLLSKTESKAEDYRDIVTEISFSDGGFFDGYAEVEITKDDQGAVVHRHGNLLCGQMFPDIRISREEWDSLLNTLYTKLHIHEWKKRYDNPCVMDGEQWALNLKLTNNRKRSIYGSNDYPPYWKELKALFMPFIE